MTVSPFVPLQVIYQDDQFLVVQTQAGCFDKFHDEPAYGQFNLALHVKDDPNQVLKNRARLLDALNQLTPTKIGSIYWLNQVHTDEIYDVDNQKISLEAARADALIGHQPAKALAIMTADCVPVVLLDKSQQRFACIHAGWQGLVQGIIAKTYANMNRQGCGQVIALMGACISWQAYEISQELAKKILWQTKDLVDLDLASLKQAIIHQSSHPDRVMIDLQKLTILQLEKLGIQPINQTAACSYLTPNLYSYRAQTHAKKSATGRMAMVVASLR